MTPRILMIFLPGIQPIIVRKMHIKSSIEIPVSIPTARGGKINANTNFIIPVMSPIKAFDQITTINKYQQTNGSNLL
jgi:hypothetical protein